MRSAIASVILFLLLAACSSSPRGSYEDWMKRPTPTTWTENPAWVFVFFDKRGDFLRSMQVRFTQREATQSCTGGDWREIDVVRNDAPRPSASGYEARPAYLVEGSALWIGLMNNLCDNNHDVRGELTSTGFDGTYRSGGIFGSEKIGRVIGVPLRDGS